MEGFQQDEARKASFHAAVRRLDLLRLAGQALGFDEVELELAFERRAKADTFGPAFPLHPEASLETKLEFEREREFVSLAEARWNARVLVFSSIRSSFF